MGMSQTHEPLRISVEIAREILQQTAHQDSAGNWWGDDHCIGTDEQVAGCAADLVDARVRPLVDLLRESRDYVADYAVDPQNAAGKILARIDAALKAAGVE